MRAYVKIISKHFPLESEMCNQCTEVRFASCQSGEFTTVAFCTDLQIAPLCSAPKIIQIIISKSYWEIPVSKHSQFIFHFRPHYNIFTRNKMNGLLRVSSNNIWADWESEMSQPVHRGAVWKFSLQWIYYCGMNKSTRLKTSKPHLCAVPKSSSKSLLANLTKKSQFQNIHN